MTHLRFTSSASAAALLLALLPAALPVAAQTPAKPGDQPVQAIPQAQLQNRKTANRIASLPAKGLFLGDQLSEGTKAKLTELIIEAIGLDVQVALLVPTGPWNIDGAGHTDRDLNEARLKALRRFLTERGVNPGRIFVESRIDARLTEPRLEVQLVGKPSGD